MAVLKHIAIKNADYSAAVCYLKYQHDERHLKPLLDENGSMMLRSEFHMNGVNCNPDTFDLECEMLNDQYRKNYRYDEVKSHHYIISFDPRDKDEHHLTGEKAQTLGLEFVKNHLPGHQACTFCTPHFFYINSNKPTADRTKAIHRRLELSCNLYLLLLFVGQNRASKSHLHITLRISRFLQFFNK